jgi:hypothetical protein
MRFFAVVLTFAFAPSGAGGVASSSSDCIERRVAFITVTNNETQVIPTITRQP